MTVAVAQDKSAIIADLQKRLAEIQAVKAQLATELAKLEALVIKKQDEAITPIAQEKQRAIDAAYNQGTPNAQIPSTQEIISGLEQLKQVKIPDPLERQPIAAEATAVNQNQPMPSQRVNSLGDTIQAQPDAESPYDSRQPLTFAERMEVDYAKPVGKFIENVGEGVYNMVAAIPQILKEYYSRPDASEEEKSQTAQQFAEARLGVSAAEYAKIKQLDPDIDEKLTWLKVYDKGYEIVKGEPVTALAEGQVEVLKNMVTSPLETFYNQPIDVAATILGGWATYKGMKAPAIAEGPKPKYIPKPDDPHGHVGVNEVVPPEVMKSKVDETNRNIYQAGLNNATFGIKKQIEVLETAAQQNPELRVELDALRMIQQRLEGAFNSKPKIQAGAAGGASALKTETTPTPPVEIAQPTDAMTVGAADAGKAPDAMASEAGALEQPLSTPKTSWDDSGLLPDENTRNNFVIETPGDPMSVKTAHGGQPIQKASYNPKTGEFIAVPPGQLHALSLRGKKFDDYVRLVFDHENNAVASRAWNPNYLAGNDYDPVVSLDGQWRAFEKMSKSRPGLRWVFDADEFITNKGDEVFDVRKVPADRVRVAESKPSQFVIGVTAHKEGLQLPGSAIAAFDQPHMVEFFTNQIFDELLPGTEVTARRPQLGVWGKYEPSYALIINDSIEAVRAYAAKLGKAADNQDAVVIADASKGGKDMFEFQLPKRLTPALLDRINAARENAGIVAGSVDLSSGKLRIYDIFGDVKGKIEQFAEELGIEGTRHDVYSELIENSQYDQYIRDWESISARRKAESAQAQMGAGRNTGRTGAVPQGESGRASGRLREEAKVLTPDAAAKLGRKLERDTPDLTDEPLGSPDGEPSGYPSVISNDAPTATKIAKTVRDEASGRPLTASDVRTYIKRAFGTPQRHGKISGALGAHWSVKEITRYAKGWARHMGVIAHELGHNIETAVWGIGGRRSELPPYFVPFKTELVKLGRALYGNTHPNGGYAREGFAEYIRKYLNDEQPDVAAPNFHQFFTENLLKNNEFISTTTSEIKAMIAEIKQQDAPKILEGMIDFSKGKRITDVNADDLKQLYHRSIIGFFDTNHVYDVVNATIKKMGGNPQRFGLSPDELARYVEKSAQAKAYSFVMDGVFDFAGNKIGKSLKEIMDDHKFKGLDDPNFREAIVYSVAKHMEWLRKRGKSHEGIDPAIISETVSRYKDKWDGFATDFTGWFNGLSRYLVEPEVGMLTEAGYNAMLDLNPFYVPLMRIFEEASGFTGGSGGGKMTNVRNPIKRVTGSDRDIRNLLGQAFEKAHQIIGAADKARIFNAVVNHAKNFQGYGKLIEEIPPDVVVSRFGLGKIGQGLQTTAKGVPGKPGMLLDEIGSILREVNDELKDADIDAIVTLYANAKNYFGKEPIAMGWKGGEVKFYYVDPFLYDALAGLDNYFLDKKLDMVFGAPARAERLGRTGANISFGLANTVRDTWTYLIQSDVGSSKNIIADVLGVGERGVKLVKAIQEEAKNYLNLQYGIGKVDPIGERMRATGVTMSQILGSDMHNLRKMRTTIDKLFENDKKARAAGILKHPLEAVRELVSITEMAPRRAAYKDVLQKMGELERAQNGRPISIEAAARAANAANEVTLNFKRIGGYVRAMNQITPFFNAVLQGPVRMGRELRNNPQRAIPRAIAYVTAPTMLLWEMNRDEEWWQELPEWRKWMFWNMRVGDQTLSIPMPFEWGVLFGALPMAVADASYRKNPEHFIEGAKEAGSSFLPSFLPTTLRVPTELAAGETGHDFFKDKPIVPFFQTINTEDPRDRYNPWTPVTYRKIAEALGYVGLRTSPLKIEHALEGFTGGLAGNVVETAEGAFKPSRMEGPADIPVVGRFFIRDKTDKAKEYELKSERAKMRNTIKNMLIRDPNSERALKLLEKWNREHPTQIITFRAGQLEIDEGEE